MFSAVAVLLVGLGALTYFCVCLIPFFALLKLQIYVSELAWIAALRVTYKLLFSVHNGKLIDAPVPLPFPYLFVCLFN